MYDTVDSKYTYKNSSVIKNRLNIKDEKTLKKYETKMVAFKLSTIRFKNINKTFDEEHIKFIHKYLFEDIYDFAGKYRTENITKDNFRFSEYQYIEENFKEIINKINIQELKNLNYDMQIKKISEIMTDLNVLHPFREGNGRTIREFIRELLNEIGYDVNFSEVDYNLIISASKKAVIDDAEQILLLKKIIYPIHQS